MWMIILNLVLMFSSWIQSTSGIEFIEWPDTCRVYVDGECELLWKVRPEILPNDPVGIAIKRGVEGNMGDVLVTFRPILSTPSFGPKYSTRDITLTGINGGEWLGITLRDIQEEDSGNYSCSYASNPSVIDDNGLIFVWTKPSQATVVQSPDPVNVSSSVTFSCSVTATSQPAAYRPPLKYTWYRNGTEIAGQTTSSYTIASVGREQWGNKISCAGKEQGSDLVSDRSDSTILKPQYPPFASDATKSPSQVTAGQITTINCTTSDPGWPLADWTWSRVDEELVTIKTCNQESSCDAQIQDTLVGSTHYRCQLSNPAGRGQSSSVSLTGIVLQKDSPDWGSDTAITELSELQLECVFKSYPQTTVTWKYNETLSLPQSVKVDTPSPSPRTGEYYVTTSRLSWSGEGNKRTASGEYVCNGSNGHNGVTNPMSYNTRLNVQYGPSSLLVTPTTRTVTEGSDVTFTCTADCNPTCSVVWKDGTGNNVGNQAELTLTQVNRNKAGTYRCEAQNTAGSETGEAVLVVQYLDTPHMSSSHSNPITAGADVSVTLTCTLASASPDATLTIRNITRDQELEQSIGNRLEYTLSSVDCLHSGEYYCEANNGALVKQSEAINMNIHCPPRVYITRPSDRKEGASLDDNVSFNLSVIANPPPTLYTWTFTPEVHVGTESELPSNAISSNEGYTSTLEISDVKENNFGVYSCAVSNGISGGQPINFTLAGEAVPDPVTNLSLVKATPVSLTVAWRPGWNGGSEQNFEVRYSSKEVTGTSALYSVSEEPTIGDGEWSGYLLSRLYERIQSERTYTVTVTPTNEKGTAQEVARLFGTLAYPIFSETEIAVFVADGYALLHLTISEGRVTHILVRACETRVGECIHSNITETTASRSKRDIPTNVPVEARVDIPANGEEYSFQITAYDGQDVVLSPDLITQRIHDGSNLGPVVGGAVGGLLLIAIIIVVIILIRRGSFSECGKGKDKNQLLNKRTQGTGGELNVLTTHDDVNPYSVSGANSRNKAMDSIRTDGPEEAVYAQVNKKPKASKNEEEDTELVDNHQYVSGPQTLDDDNDTELVDNTVYDSAPKSKKKPPHRGKGKPKIRRPLDDKPPAILDQTYQNVAETNQADRHNPVLMEEEPGDKVVYTQVAFQHETNGQKKKIIHGKEDRVAYSTIDFPKSGKPVVSERR